MRCGAVLTPAGIEIEHAPGPGQYHCGLPKGVVRLAGVKNPTLRSPPFVWL